MRWLLFKGDDCFLVFGGELSVRFCGFGFGFFFGAGEGVGGSVKGARGDSWGVSGAFSEFEIENRGGRRPACCCSSTVRKEDVV